jgi:hypothetical protein
VRTDSSKTLQRTPLRVGVMIRGDSVPGWVARVLDRIDACSFSELVGFVLRSPPPTVARLWADRSRLLYVLYARLDRRRVGAVLDPLDATDVSRRLARLPTLSVDDGPLTTLEKWEALEGRSWVRRPVTGL